MTIQTTQDEEPKKLPSVSANMPVDHASYIETNLLIQAFRKKKAVFFLSKNVNIHKMK